MAPSIAPISIRLYHNILVSGCPVEGEIELNFRGIQEDGIEEVHVKLRGIVRTYATIPVSSRSAVAH